MRPRGRGVRAARRGRPLCVSPGAGLRYRGPAIQAQPKSPASLRGALELSRHWQHGRGRSLRVRGGHLKIASGQLTARDSQLRLAGGLARGARLPLCARGMAGGAPRGGLRAGYGRARGRLGAYSEKGVSAGARGGGREGAISRTPMTHALLSSVATGSDVQRGLSWPRDPFSVLSAVFKGLRDKGREGRRTREGKR